jgi:hypothetical protein
MNKRINKSLSIVLIITTALFGCQGPAGEAGWNSVVKTSTELPGDNCSNGGIKIESGIDINGNGVLDLDEIDQTQYVCNGEEGEEDKLITLLVGGWISNNTDIPVVYSSSLPYFDIRNYSNIDSAFLYVSDIKTFDEYNNDIVGEGTIELYDMTNNQVIENCSIISDDIPSGTYIRSSNFIQSIPEAEIRLGTRITGGSDYMVSCGNVFLILKRR